MRKRMYGKLTALALAGAMVLSGCGQSGGNSGTSTADSKAETSAYPVYGSTGGGGFTICNAEFPYL